MQIFISKYMHNFEVICSSKGAQQTDRVDRTTRTAALMRCRSSHVFGTGWDSDTTPGREHYLQQHAGRNLCNSNKWALHFCPNMETPDCVQITGSSIDQQREIERYFNHPIQRYFSLAANRVLDWLTLHTKWQQRVALQ